MEWSESDGVRWLVAELEGGGGRATAAFTARVGGVSEPPYASLNLGLLTGDDPDAVRENRHRAATAVGVDPRDVVIARQVHGVELVEHDGPQRPPSYAVPGPSVRDADGHATAIPGLAPLVFVADCLPVALAGPGGAAMVHCGWRGLAGGIVERGAAAVAATNAAIGPGIGPCCYEVGDEVLEAFAPLGEGVAEGRMLDLGAVATRLLVQAGVEHVEAAGLCTSCNPDLFFSHRRDGGQTGRQAGLVWLDG
jgi:YfiH family protein